MTQFHRDKWVQMIALTGLVLTCWWYLLEMSRDMSSMKGVMAIGPWSRSDWLMMFAMWIIMMTGMMVPTATRSILIFNQIGVQAERRGLTRVSGLWFAAGYAAIWGVFGIAATFAQWGLDQAAMLSPMMVATSPYLGALLLVGAGVWQLSPLKRVCLRHCQAPAMFIARHFRSGPAGAMQIGLRHGLYCIGCCWALMALLFVGGVMNLAWIALITLFVLGEKLLPAPFAMSRVSGWLMITIGGAFFVRGTMV